MTRATAERSNGRLLSRRTKVAMDRTRFDKCEISYQRAHVGSMFDPSEQVLVIGVVLIDNRCKD